MTPQNPGVLLNSGVTITAGGLSVFQIGSERATHAPKEHIVRLYQERG